SGRQERIWMNSAEREMMEFQLNLVGKLLKESHHDRMIASARRAFVVAKFHESQFRIDVAADVRHSGGEGSRPSGAGCGAFRMIDGTSEGDAASCKEQRGPDCDQNRRRNKAKRFCLPHGETPP